ncbi:MAG: phage late control D family protein, partial [Proteobacteria bacterium]|nr:phage late control D family protein [Pseudomonadota bacterium]
MNNYSHFELELENLMKTQILQFSGFNDGLNSDYQFQIDFLSSTKCDPGKILNSNACFMRYANTGKIYTHGIIDKIQYFGRLDNSYHYQVYLSSPLCRLKKQIRNRRFINKKATQIIQEVLLEAGWKTIDFQIQIETYNPIISCFTQYNEPDHQLIERLCTRYGWIYYFSRDKQRVILHLKDNCKAIQTFKLSYYPNTQLKLDKISISQIQQFINFLPKNIQLKNYSLTTPDTDLTVKTTSKSLIESRGVLEIYGIDYETHEEGEFLAD